MDNIQDPGNLGTIIRTALALGYDQIIMSYNSVDLYNDKVHSCNTGSTFSNVHLSNGFDRSYHVTPTK